MRTDSRMRERRRPDALCGSRSRPARRAERNSFLPLRAAACAAPARGRARAPRREAGRTPGADGRRAGTGRHVSTRHRLGVAVGRGPAGRGPGLGAARRFEREDRRDRQRRRRERARPRRQVAAHLERPLRIRLASATGSGTAPSSRRSRPARSRTATGISGFGGDAQLLVVQAIDADGYITDVDEAAAIVYAVRHGAKIVNLSIGGNETSQVEQRAIRWAARRGVLIVAAAGNEHDEGNLARLPGRAAAAARLARPRRDRPRGRRDLDGRHARLLLEHRLLPLARRARLQRLRGRVGRRALAARAAARGPRRGTTAGRAARRSPRPRWPAWPRSSGRPTRA